MRVFGGLGLGWFGFIAVVMVKARDLVVSSLGVEGIEFVVGRR